MDLQIKPLAATKYPNTNCALSFRTLTGWDWEQSIAAGTRQQDCKTKSTSRDGLIDEHDEPDRDLNDQQRRPESVTVRELRLSPIVRIARRGRVGFQDQRAVPLLPLRPESFLHRGRSHALLR